MPVFEKSVLLSQDALAHQLAGNLNYTFKSLNKRPVIVSCTVSGHTISFERKKTFQKDTDVVIKGEGTLTNTGTSTAVQLRLKVKRRNWWWQLLLLPVFTGLLVYSGYLKGIKLTAQNAITNWLQITGIFSVILFGLRIIREQYQLKLCKQELADAMDYDVAGYTSKMMQKGDYVM